MDINYCGLYYVLVVVCCCVCTCVVYNLQKYQVLSETNFLKEIATLERLLKKC